MLNRKISNYLFYGILIVIIALVLLVRSITLGNINEKITLLENQNISLQAANNSLEIQVEDYKDIESDYLYELYRKVPSYFSETELAYFVIAQLESIGIDESFNSNRKITVDTKVSFPAESELGLLKDDFKIVEVQVYFNTLDSSVTDDFIDLIYGANQVFIINHIEYNTPDGVNYIGVSINFLAFYEKEEDAS